MHKYMTVLVAIIIAGTTAPASAQTARNFDGTSVQPIPVAAAQDGKRAKTCKGTVRGKRWYLTTSTPVTTAVVDVRDNGTIKRQARPSTKAQSEAFGSKNIQGGQLTDNAPIYDPDQPNHCYVLGTVEMAGGHYVEIWNAFISRRGGPISGNCTVDGIHETLCTMVRH